MRADLPPPHVLPGEDQPSSSGVGTPRPWLPTPGTYRYFRYVARSVGVPNLWLDDSVADMVFTCWRRGNARPGTVRSAAIDAVRRYGPYGRSGPRLALVPLIYAYYVGIPPEEPIFGLRTALAALTAKQRTSLMRRLNGLPMSNLDSRHASTARQRLRRLLCA